MRRDDAGEVENRCRIKEVVAQTLRGSIPCATFTCLWSIPLTEYKSVSIVMLYCHSSLHRRRNDRFFRSKHRRVTSQAAETRESNCIGCALMKIDESSMRSRRNKEQRWVVR